MKESCDYFPNVFTILNYRVPSLRVDKERMPGHFIFGINAALVQQRQQYTGEVDKCRLKHLVRHREVLVTILRRVEMRQGDAVGPVSP